MLDVFVLSILSLGSFFVDFNYNLLSCVLLYIFRCFSLTIQRHWRSISLYICTKRVEILTYSSVSILEEFQVYLCKNHLCRDISASQYGKIALNRLYISAAVQRRNVISTVALPRRWLSRLIFLPVSWTVQIAKKQLLQVLSKLDLNSLFLKQILKGEYWVIKCSHGPNYLHLLDLKINWNIYLMDFWCHWRWNIVLYGHM